MWDQGKVGRRIVTHRVTSPGGSRALGKLFHGRFCADSELEGTDLVGTQTQL